MNLQDVRRDVHVIDRERDEMKPKQPPMYNVLLNNDDYTSGEVVMIVLQQIFGKNQQAAIQLMLRAHREGKTVVNTFSKEVAETKTAQAIDMAKQVQGQIAQQLNRDDEASSYLFTTEPAE